MQSKYLVLGAGISGLAAALRLRELEPGARVSLWEKSNRPGGVLHTVERGGFQFEQSTDNFITFVPWGLNLCAKLGLTDRLVRTNNRDRRTYVARRGKLYPLPDGFMMLAPTRLWPMVTTPLLSPLGKARAGLELFLPRLADDRDESIAQFARRRLGREVFDRIVEPLLSGIYAGDAEKISLLATLPRFREMEKNDRSLILAMTKTQKEARRAKREEESGARYSMFVTLKDGLSHLASKCAEALGEGVIQYGRAAARVDRLPGENGAPRWRKVAFLRRPMAPKVPHTVTVSLERRSGTKELTVSCGGISFGYADDLLPDSFYAGITGCEGRCRFYDFKVKAGLPELSDEAAALADGEH